MDNGYNFPEKDFTSPKELTNFFPRTNPHDIVGREEDVVQLRMLLEKEKRVALISSWNGTGKTTLAEAYISDYYKEYEHVAWITRTSGSIVDDFALTFGLARCLNIPITNAGFEELFRAIINKMESLSGDNLLVIDDANHGTDTYQDLLQHHPQWHLLIISNQPIEGFHSKPIDLLNEDEAVALYQKLEGSDDTQEAEIRKLIRLVGCHTLAVEIMAKTARTQGYAPTDLQTAMEESSETGAQKEEEKLIDCLSTIFALSGLGESELRLLKQFACLPAGFHDPDDLEDLLLFKGDEEYDSVSEALDGLAEKGWLIYNLKTDGYRIHEIVLELMQKKAPVTPDDIDNLVYRVTRNLCAENLAEKMVWIPYARTLLKKFPGHQSANFTTLQNNLALALKDLGGA